jgi:hypothetical protein
MIRSYAPSVATADHNSVDYSAPVKCPRIVIDKRTSASAGLARHIVKV